MANDVLLKYFSSSSSSSSASSSADTTNLNNLNSNLNNYKGKILLKCVSVTEDSSNSNPTNSAAGGGGGGGVVVGEEDIRVIEIEYNSSWSELEGMITDRYGKIPASVSFCDEDKDWIKIDSDTALKRAVSKYESDHARSLRLRVLFTKSNNSSATLSNSNLSC